jgi:hypothetical protein
MKEYLGIRTQISDLSIFNFEFSMGIALLLIIQFDVSVYNGFMWLNIADRNGSEYMGFIKPEHN